MTTKLQRQLDRRFKEAAIQSEEAKNRILAMEEAFVKIAYYELNCQYTYPNRQPG